MATPEEATSRAMCTCSRHTYFAGGIGPRNRVSSGSEATRRSRLSCRNPSGGACVSDESAGIHVHGHVHGHMGMGMEMEMDMDTREAPRLLEALLQRFC